jgi:hypothetical protein
MTRKQAAADRARVSYLEAGTFGAWGFDRPNRFRFRGALLLRLKCKKDLPYYPY